MRLLRFLILISTAAAFAAWAKDAVRPADDAVYGALAFRSLGPLVGGRMTRVAGVPGAKVFYATAAQGGVWKSTNDGIDWAPIFDGEFSQSIGSIAVAPSDPNVVYVGGGEANPRGNVALGHGIWRSTDAGARWAHVLKLKGQIGAIAVHPANADIAFAAVLGSPFGPGPERGVYRTLDGGKSWTAVLKVDDETGASDVAIDPHNPRIVYAGMWQMQRTPWSMQSGGEGGGLYRSSDGGATFEKIAHEIIPTGVVGKIGVAFAPSQRGRIFALIEAEQGGLFRSDDGGGEWTRVNDHPVLTQRAWYYMTMNVDPKNADVIWFPQVGLLRSKDGGKTVTQVDGPHHGDHHDLWIDPTNPQRIVNGNDGGIDVSLDGGNTWTHPLLPIAQFYNIDVDDRVPYHVGGTMQDWGTVSGPSRSLRGPHAVGEWLNAGGGEAADFVYDPFRPGHIYAGEYMGYLSHYVENTGQYRNISVQHFNGSGIAPEKHPYRFQWTAPAHASPHRDGGLYHGGNVLFRTKDQGQTWTAISPDLTRNDKRKQQWSGGPITGDNTGVEVYGTILSVAESPVRRGVIWTGSDDGLVHVTQDDGATWTNVTPKALPEWATVEGIDASRTDPGTMWFVAHRYRLDDHRPYVFFTRDFGKTWQQSGKGLPDDLPLYSVRVDPADARFVFLGSERGVWYSRDGGSTFSGLKLNLPPVTVTDMEIKHGDLVIGTRGRGLWALEQIATLRAFDDAARKQPVHLFATRATHRFREDGSWSRMATGTVAEDNEGALLHYWLAVEPKPPATLTIKDANGRVVRTLSSEKKPGKYPEDDPDEPSGPPEADLSADEGLNATVWDLREDGARRIPFKADMGDPETGPYALPGTYTLALTADGKTSTTTLEVLADPRSPIHIDDLRANHALALLARDGLTRLSRSIDRVRALREQLDLFAKHAATVPNGTDLLAAIKSATAQVDAIEGTLHNPEAIVNYDILSGRGGGAKLFSQLAPLYSTISDSDHRPTQSMLDRADILLAELAQREAAIQALRSNELATVEAEADKLGLARILMP
ncbi:MAG TPA: glycosyl hydrolase [Patescibacteria group bacterium]|nr:glycosyl hydrolase [Patescibacteria group bacterium]